ncbi:MAG: EamA family transporter [Opitutaceae bacterium]
MTQPSELPQATEPAWRVALAFAVIYVVWGTTYFVVGKVVHEWPPLLMTAGRFLVAGPALYLLRRARGAMKPTKANWLAAAWISALLLLGGYGTTAWAQQHVPSGLTALIVAVTPLTMALIEWLRPRGNRPAPAVFLGLFLGFAGMILLIGPARLETARDAGLLPALACAGAAVCWATGSVLGRQARQAGDALLAASMQMLLGAVWLVAAAVAFGEFSRLPETAWRWELFGGWAYLTLAGSLAAYTAYIYLLKVSTPARVSTYAYINPAVAVCVGWALGGEVVTGRMAIAAGLLLGGVALITARKRTG